MTQQGGAGEGTVERQRRDPRMRVQDVAIHEASGLSLGEDGYPHPLETTVRGELKTTSRTERELLEECLLVLKQLRYGLSELVDKDLSEV